MEVHNSIAVLNNKYIGLSVFNKNCGFGNAPVIANNLL